MAWETLARRSVRVASRDAAFIRDPTVRLVFRHHGGLATLERTAPSAGPEAERGVGPSSHHHTAWNPRPASSSASHSTASSSGPAARSSAPLSHSHVPGTVPAPHAPQHGASPHWQADHAAASSHTAHTPPEGPALHAPSPAHAHAGGSQLLPPLQGRPDGGGLMAPPDTFIPRVHGVLYCTTREELHKMHERKHGYQLQQMEVETYGGRVVTAQVFVSHPQSLLRRPVAPPESYMCSLRRAAADQFLDPVYQAWLSSIATVTSVGLGPEYYDTPARSRAIALAMLLVGAATLAGIALAQLQ